MLNVEPHLNCNACTIVHLMHHIAHCILVLIVLFISLYVLFASSRVVIDTEQFETEFLYITPEDRVRVFSSDLTGESTSFTYFTVSLSLFSCYQYVVFCCVTSPFPHVTHMIHVTSATYHLLLVV